MTLPACGARKGVITAVRVVKSKGDGTKPLMTECTRCGQRWPLGARHP